MEEVQNIPFDFVISNFIGNNQQPFNNNLDKLKYPNFDYFDSFTYKLNTKDGQLKLDLLFKKNKINDTYLNMCYLVLNNNYYRMNSLDYNTRSLTLKFIYDNNYSIYFIIENKDNKIKCYINLSNVVGFTDQTIISYIGKNFFFDLKGTKANTKQCIEMKKSEYNNTYLSLLSQEIYEDESTNYKNKIEERVKYCNSHLTVNSQSQYIDIIKQEGRKVLMAINNSCKYKNNNTNVYFGAVIYIDIETKLNDNNISVTINNIYIDYGEVKYILPENKNDSIVFSNNNYDKLRINKIDCCLFYLISLNGQNDTEFSDNYYDIDLYYIGIRNEMETYYNKNLSNILCYYLLYRITPGLIITIKLPCIYCENGNEIDFIIQISFISSVKCNISLYTINENNLFEFLYSIDQINYNIKNQEFIILDRSNIVLQFNNSSSTINFYTKYNEGLAKEIFLPGILFQNIKNLSNTLFTKISDYYYEINDELYNGISSSKLINLDHDFMTTSISYELFKNNLFGKQNSFDLNSFNGLKGYISLLTDLNEEAIIEINSNEMTFSFGNNKLKINNVNSSYYWNNNHYYYNIKFELNDGEVNVISYEDVYKENKKYGFTFNYGDIKFKLNNIGYPKSNDYSIPCPYGYDVYSLNEDFYNEHKNDLTFYRNRLNSAVLTNSCHFIITNIDGLYTLFNIDDNGKVIKSYCISKSDKLIGYDSNLLEYDIDINIKNDQLSTTIPNDLWGYMYMRTLMNKEEEKNKDFEKNGITRQIICSLRKIEDIKYNKEEDYIEISDDTLKKISYKYFKSGLFSKEQISTIFELKKKQILYGRLKLLDYNNQMVYGDIVLIAKSNNIMDILIYCNNELISDYCLYNMHFIRNLFGYENFMCKGLFIDYNIMISDFRKGDCLKLVFKHMIENIFPIGTTFSNNINEYDILTNNETYQGYSIIDNVNLLHVKDSFYNFNSFYSNFQYNIITEINSSFKKINSEVNFKLITRILFQYKIDKYYFYDCYFIKFNSVIDNEFNYNVTQLIINFNSMFEEYIQINGSFLIKKILKFINLKLINEQKTIINIDLKNNNFYGKIHNTTHNRGKDIKIIEIYYSFN